MKYENKAMVRIIKFYDAGVAEKEKIRDLHTLGDLVSTGIWP